MSRKIKTNLNYSVILLAVLLLFFGGLFVDSILRYSNIPYPLFWGGCLAIIAVVIVISNQTMILTTDGFVIRCMLFQIVSVKWEQIAKIDLRESDSLYSAYSAFKCSWVVFLTDAEQKCPGGGANWKNSPWTVKATPKNISAIKEFAPDELVKF